MRAKTGRAIVRRMWAFGGIALLVGETLEREARQFIGMKWPFVSGDSTDMAIARRFISWIARSLYEPLVINPAYGSLIQLVGLFVLATGLLMFLHGKYYRARKD